MDKIDEYINSKIQEKIHGYVKDALSRGLSEKEISDYLIYKGHDKHMVHKIIKENTPKHHKERKPLFQRKEKEEKEEPKEEFVPADFTKKKIGPRLKLAIIMIAVFIVATSASLIIQSSNSTGTCPSVSEYEVQKLASVSFSGSDELTYPEMEQIVGAYLGKEDCTGIDRSTIKRLRKIDIDS